MAVQQPKVLFITRRFPPSVGGMERFAYDLSEALNQKAELTLIKWSGKNKYIPVVLMPLFFVRASWVMVTKQIDIIHMQDGVFSILGAMLKFIFRKPMVVVIHGLDATHKSKLYQLLIRRSLKYADHIFCISHVAMDEVTKRGISADKVSVISLGVTDDIYSGNKAAARQLLNDKLALNAASKIILSTGRLVKRKGLNWFIANVMPGLVSQNSNIILIVSGDGPDRLAIESTIQKFKLQNNIKLLGRTDDQLLSDLYNGSDVFVMPNIYVDGDMEGFGRVLVEAALCELPVVAAGIEGITDAIVDGQNGILVAEKDVATFTSKIQFLLSDPKAAQALGSKAREFSLKTFAWDNIAQRYVEEYAKLLV